MEFQNYALVSEKMNKMKTIFDEYVKIINDVNDMIEEEINNGTNSALLSKILAKTFKATWEELYSSFNQLSGYFNNIYSNVGTTTEENVKLEEEANDSFKSISIC